MRTPLAVLSAVAAASVVAVLGTGGSAQALGVVPAPTLTPLPTLPLPSPTAVVPLPTATSISTPTATVPLPGTTLPGTGASSGTGGSGSSSGSSGSGTTATGGGGSLASDPGTSAGSSVLGAPAPGSPEALRRARLAKASTPMIAGTPAARDLLDDESSPELLAASRDFLAADQGIAEIARQKRLMADLKQRATEMALVYRQIDLDVATAQGRSDAIHQRHGEVLSQWKAGAREAYVTGSPTTDDATTVGIAEALARLSDSGARADLRVGALTVRRGQVRTDFELVAARYNEAQRRLEGAQQRLAALAAARSSALVAVQAAGAGDAALQQARLVESGQLGAQIRVASAALQRSGETVSGTGQLASPLEGQVTSAYGMRMHPILRYAKLHTGLDIAGGSTVRAADDGRVIMTVANTAYGNFTVIDHGVIDGIRLTTAYAHQAAFLVSEGQEVRKGDEIGVVGSTGYSTGPHLHFEVREDGAVVDPMTWLARG